jgi:glycosyltransferase involved in cell wall biosynthesis
LKSLNILQFVKGSERYGASVSIRNLCGELKRRGHEVALLVFKGRSLGPEIEGLGVRKIEIDAYRKFDLRAIKRLAALFKAEGADIVHTHLSAATLTGTLAARMARVPVVSTVHGMNKRWTYSFADHLIAVSEAGRQNLIHQGISPKQVSVAYNGIPIPPLPHDKERRLFRESLGIPPDACVLGSVSRADYGKGIQDGISALAMLRRRYPNLHYLIAGEGEYLAQLKLQSKALGVGDLVHFLGFRDDVLPVLSAIDVFVFPSLKEAMGISIVEAMAAGVPIVGTNIGGIPEVVDEGSGVLVPPQSPCDIADGCSKLIEEPRRRHSMGMHARQRAESKFSLTASAIAVEAVYRQVLKLAS